MAFGGGGFEKTTTRQRPSGETRSMAGPGRFARADCQTRIMMIGTGENGRQKEREERRGEELWDEGRRFGVADER